MKILPHFNGCLQTLFFYFYEKEKMLQLGYKKHVFNFKRPAGTSRGVLQQKTSYYLTVWDTEAPEIKGIGECSTIKGLSPDPWGEIVSFHPLWFGNGTA